MFFEVDETFLVAIKNLEGNANWKVIKDRINALSDLMTSNTLHTVPPKNDFNYQVRFHINQGISIALDALKHIMNDPDDLLMELREMKKLNEALSKSEGASE